MKPLFLTVSLCLAYGGILASVHAQVTVYNSFGPGNSYDTSTSWVVQGASVSGGYHGQAQAFTPTVSGDLSSIELATQNFGGSDLSNFFIAQDNGSGVPGTILESFNNTANPNGLLIINSIVDPFLQAGTQYWLCDEPATATSDNAWYFNNQNQIGFANERSQWNWSAFPAPDSFQGGVFEITVTPVPEPSSLALVSLGGLLLVRRRTTPAR